MFYTYCHTRNDTGKIFYIGKGTRKYRASSKDQRNKYWQNIVNKHGFKSEILAHWNTEKEAFEHEKLLILCFKDMGYTLANMTEGGEGCSKPSVEIRKKMSLSKLGKPSPRKGAILSNEIKEKLRQANLGKKMSEEQKNKISKALKNKQFSKQHCKNLSLAAKNKKMSNETKLKMSISAKKRWAKNAG